MTRRADRARKMAEFEKWKNPPKANFVISKRLAGEEGAEVHVPLTSLIIVLVIAVNPAKLYRQSIKVWQGSDTLVPPAVH